MCAAQSSFRRYIKEKAIVTFNSRSFTNLEFVHLRSVFEYGLSTQQRKIYIRVVIISVTNKTIL